MASYNLSQGLRSGCRALCAAIVVLVGVTSSYAGERHALVVGVERYERARDLRNPGRDAQAVAMRLQALGYTLYGDAPLTDPSRDDLLAAMRDFASSLPEGATAVVYLAGHGLSEGGDSYLIPSDDNALQSRADLDRHAVALRALTGRLAARRGVHSVVLLDACRANGLRGQGPGVGGAGDLVAGSSGSMSLVYAAAPGQIAADGTGETSPFATALLYALEQPSAPLDALIRRLARRLQSDTDGAQTPWIVRSYGDVAPVHLVPR